MAERATLAFVDNTYVKTDGGGGSIVLDCNDGASYEFMLDSFAPHPAAQRQAISDSALLDGRSFRPGIGKLESVILPFSVKVKGDDADDRREKAVALLNTARDHTLHVVYSPAGSDVFTFYDIIPASEFRSESYWSRPFERANQAVIDFEVEASCGYGAKRSVDILKNEAPNPTVENWTGLALDEWTITVGGASAITEEAGTVLDGAASVKMVRNAGDCYFSATGYIAIDAADSWYFDAHVYSASALEMTFAVDCYDEAGLIDSVEYTGDTRGGTAWDREVVRLYRAGTVTHYYISPALWPEGTTKVKLRIQLNENGTVYVDKLIFSNVRYVSGRTFDGVVGICIPEGELEGDLPALCELNFSNPFSTPPWRAALSGVSDNLYALSFLDATHNWAVGAGGRILFGDGLSWTPQASGVTKHLYSISAFDATHAWAVGEDGTIRFSADGGATWAAQTFPTLASPALPYPGFEEGSGSPRAFTHWSVSDTDYVYPLTGQGRSGSYCCACHAHAYSAEAAGTKTTNLAEINPNKSYAVKIWELGGAATAYNTHWRAMFYDSSDVYLGYKDSGNFKCNASWTQKTISITPADYPAGTAKLGIRVYNPSAPGTPLSLWDDVTITLTGTYDLNGVHAIAANNIIAVGEAGVIIKSADGTTWTEKTSGTSYHLRAVHADAATRIYAVGDSGVILTSVDGTTWTARTSGVSSNLYSVYALDATHAWAVGAGGVILFSGDAGATWEELDSGVEVDLHGVYAADSTHIWVVGAGGTLLFSDGDLWSVHAPGVSSKLRAVDGISNTNVWAVGDAGSLTHGIQTSGALAATNLIIGQRDEHHDSFDPVAKCAEGTLAYSPNRYQGDYRILSAEDTADFIYNLLAHAGSYYAISAGISFSAATAYDKATIRKLLRTAAGVDLTAQYQSDEIDAGDPNTDWYETLLLDTTWEDAFIPSHVVSDDALLSNIDQVIRMVAHASLAAVKLWVDHVAIIPTDRWVRVDDINSNYLIVDSTMGVVLDSIDGGPSTAMTHDPTDVIGTPRFQADPAGTNIAVVAINEVSGDMQLDMVNIELTYRPRTKLHL